MKIGPSFPKLSFTACLNRQAQADFQPQSVEQAVDGMVFSKALKTARPETDRTLKSDRLNPASDALLLNLIDKLPRSLASMTWSAIKRWVHKGDATPEPLKDKQGADFQVGKQVPIRLDALMDTLKTTMTDFTPSIGAEHVWSKDAKGYQGLGFWSRVGSFVKGERPFPFPTFGRSKLICALGLGATAVVMPTGQEKGLREWMLQQQKGSIELHQLFGQAYKLNQGDLYSTLLCAENVLSEGLYDPNRQDREVISKLSYLRSDSAPLGDNFGGWYHLFGAALYSLMRPEWKSDVCLKVEDMGSFILEGKDPQEDHINQLGKQLGIELKKIAREGLEPGAGARPYLNLQEFGWNRKSVVVTGAGTAGDRNGRS
ncbi:MAG: hypothetical protein J0I12_12665 [Candidatus Eremiobacteraeota bacterium]|nr:hypothetical protein [Candidatus Eremiobacteraeota bacterium]